MEPKTISYTTTSVSRITREGERIYQEKLKKVLEPKYTGQFVVIESESGDYFIGKDPSSANKKAQKKYKDKVFYLKKIGFETTFKFHAPISAGTTTTFFANLYCDKIGVKTY